MPQYLLNPPLDVADLLPDPLAQFQRWHADAVAVGMIEPNAMALATVGEDGQPSCRIVLFKGFSGGAFSFYTHYDSRKGAELAACPRAAATFWWDRLERQVRIEGRVERLPRAESEAYFRSRPRGSQIGGATSRQSSVVASRAELDRRLAETERLYEGLPIPLPEQWGGYALQPEAIEFWQGRGDRVHDRLLYRRHGEGWGIERLEP